jgi:uncharacterized membrane protein
MIINNKTEKVKSLRKNFYFGISGILFLFLFITYVWGQPILFNKNYDHAGLLISFSDLLNFNIIKDKLWYLFMLLLPFLFFPLLNKKAFLFAIPSFPFLLFSMASKVPNFYQPGVYYGDIPTIIFAVASLAGLKKSYPQYLINMKSSLAIILICISFVFSEWSPLRIIAKSLSKEYVSLNNFAGIPKSSNILASESLIPLLPNYNSISTIEFENYKYINYDFLVIRRDEVGKLLGDYQYQINKVSAFSTDELYIFKK